MSITIESGIPVPEGRIGTGMAALREALRGMQPGQSFTWTKNNRHPYRAAKDVGCRIVTRKLPEGGWRIWRVS